MVLLLLVFYLFTTYYLANMSILGKVLIGLGTSFLLLGSMIKILHWPYANQFYIIGTLVSIAAVWIILFSKSK